MKVDAAVNEYVRRGAEVAGVHGGLLEVLTSSYREARRAATDPV